MNREQLERAKDRAPTTDTFIWWPVLFLALAWMCKSELPQQVMHISPPADNLTIMGVHIL